MRLNDVIILLEIDLSIKYKKNMKLISANKLAEIIDRNSDSLVNVRKIKKILNKESKYWTESIISISNLIGVNDLDVDKSYADFSKGSIVVLSNGTIVDGRHRASMILHNNKDKINAYIPVNVLASRENE